MDPVGIVSGAVLGVALQTLLDSVINAITSSKRFRKAKNQLETKLRTLILKINSDLKFPQVETLELCELFKMKAKGLISTSSEISRRHVVKKHCYKKRMKKLAASLDEFIKVDLQSATLKEKTAILKKVIDMNKKLMLVDENKENSSNRFNPPGPKKNIQVTYSSEKRTFKFVYIMH